jgi:branched-chain amino acid transport system permease protein
VVGAIVFHLLQRYLADFGAWYLILLGTLGIAIMLLAPRGIWGLISERTDVTLFPIRRRLVVRVDIGEGSQAKPIRD